MFPFVDPTDPPYCFSEGYLGTTCTATGIQTNSVVVTVQVSEFFTTSKCPVRQKDWLEAIYGCAAKKLLGRSGLS